MTHRPVALLLLPALAAAGCATTTHMSPAGVAAMAEVEPDAVRAVAVPLAAGGTVRMELDAGATPPGAVLESVTVVRRGRGALEGLALGTAAGLVVGGIVAASANSDDECGTGDDIATGACGVIVGPAEAASDFVTMTALGALTGLAFGALIGHRDTYRPTSRPSLSVAPTAGGASVGFGGRF